MSRVFLVSLVAAVGAAIASGGCLYVAAVPSVQGHAFVAYQTVAGSTFWNCDATGPAPICYQTSKLPLPKSK